MKSNMILVVTMLLGVMQVQAVGNNMQPGVYIKNHLQQIARELSNNNVHDVSYEDIQKTCDKLAGALEIDFSSLTPVLKAYYKGMVQGALDKQSGMFKNYEQQDMVLDRRENVQAVSKTLEVARAMKSKTSGFVSRVREEYRGSSLRRGLDVVRAVQRAQ